MQRSYKLLSILLAIGWSALFLLQATTHVLNNGSNASKARPAHQTKSMTHAATPITIITGGQGGTHFVPEPECQTGITSTPADVLKLLAPGWTLNDLGEQYQNEKKQTLCYDGWKDEWSKPGGTWIKISDFLTLMSWPPDLFNPSAGTQMLIVQRPHDVLKPSNPTTPTETKKPSEAEQCTWKPDLVVTKPEINLCEFARVILNAVILSPLKGAVTFTTGDTNSFMWTTSPKTTYANPDLALFWNTSLYIVNALLAVVVAWIGIRYMMSKSLGSWLSYADLLEILPRLIMALIAAYISARICQVVIDGSNALSSIFNHDLLGTLQQDEPKDLFALFAQIFLCILILILILEEAVRFAILFVLIGFAPIWAFSGALRETQFIFKGGLKALFFVSVLQPSQIAVLALGQHLTKSIGGNAGSPLYYLVSLALMLFVLFMMSWFLRAGGVSMPFGLTGAAALALSGRSMGRMIGGTVRAGGRGIGKAINRGANTGGAGTAGNGGAAGGGAAGGGGGSNNNGKGGSNNKGSRPNSGTSQGRRKVKRLPPYDPYKNVIKNARSTRQAARRPTCHPPQRNTKPLRARP